MLEVDLHILCLIGICWPSANVKRACSFNSIFNFVPSFPYGIPSRGLIIQDLRWRLSTFLALGCSLFSVIWAVLIGVFGPRSIELLITFFLQVGWIVKFFRILLPLCLHLSLWFWFWILAVVIWSRLQPIGGLALLGPNQANNYEPYHKHYKGQKLR
mgnify:CR=1 FL=1